MYQKKKKNLIERDIIVGLCRSCQSGVERMLDDIRSKLMTIWVS